MFTVSTMLPYSQRGLPIQKSTAMSAQPEGQSAKSTSRVQINMQPHTHSNIHHFCPFFLNLSLKHLQARDSPRADCMAVSCQQGGTLLAISSFFKSHRYKFRLGRFQLYWQRENVNATHPPFLE